MLFRSEHNAGASCVIPMIHGPCDYFYVPGRVFAPPARFIQGSYERRALRHVRGAAVAYAIAGRWSVCTVEWTAEPGDRWTIGDCVEVADRWDAARRLESYQRTGAFGQPASEDAVAAEDASG